MGIVCFNPRASMKEMVMEDVPPWVRVLGLLFDARNCVEDATR